VGGGGDEERRSRRRGHADGVRRTARFAPRSGWRGRRPVGKRHSIKGAVEGGKGGVREVQPISQDIAFQGEGIFRESGGRGKGRKVKKQAGWSSSEKEYVNKEKWHCRRRQANAAPRGEGEGKFARDGQEKRKRKKGTYRNGDRKEDLTMGVIANRDGGQHA